MKIITLFLDTLFFNSIAIQALTSSVTNIIYWNACKRIIVVIFYDDEKRQKKLVEKN
jgi:hypothetical protein